MRTPCHTSHFRLPWFAVPIPFHYAFPVVDLASTRRFYGELLRCVEGRSTDTWVDFDFFGHQISAHVSAVMPKQVAHGHVDGIEVPIPHFGAILEWDEFDRLAKRLEAANIAFVITPRIRYAGQPGEQATMFLCDFSGNPLEFKAFRHPENVFTA
jgi:uncharacterized protein